ncbi:MAG: hypothetical protein NUV40_01500 [Patescibacteria group bacterium]|nr:hypothetical protein [Patescibacteria group bacterium]
MPKNTTKEKTGSDLYAEWVEIPRSFIESALQIKTEDQRRILFEFNNVQNMLYQKIDAIRQQKKPVRIIILKARQEGVSTFTEGMIFQDTSLKPNVNSLIVAHEPESTEAIFEMSKLFYDMMPKLIRPLKRYDNKKQLVFDNPDEKARVEKPGLRSRIVIATAGKVKIGRGLTIHNFHGSEVAFWKDGKELMLSVMQAIPDLPNTMVILESTANGFGGDGEYFYNMVQDARSGKNDFELIFLPWHLMPKYSIPFSSEEEKTKFTETLDVYEKEIQKSFNLKLKQLNWRRWAIKNKCGGDTDKFKQEYPITIEEAFVASASTVIPKQHIEAQRKFIREPIDKLDGDVLIYGHVKNNHYYSLGGDPSEGAGRDDSAFTVIDKMTGREVAHYANNRIPPDLFAKKMVKTAEYFQNAIIVPEINGHGIAVLNELQKLEYPNIFRQRYYDHTSKQWTRRLGWKTTKITKPLMVDEFKEGLREEEIGMSSAATVGQMLTFVHTNEAGHHGMGAETGQKDDRLISAMLAWQGLKDLPSEFIYD